MLLFLINLISGSIGLYTPNALATTDPQKYDLRLRDSLDNGKLWPKKKALMRHDYLSEMKTRMSQMFSDARQRKKKIQEMQQRVEVLEHTVGKERE